MIPGNIISNKGKIHFQIPTDWTEVTTGQVIALNNAKGEFEILAILTGLDISIWMDVPERFKNEWIAKLSSLLITPQVDWFALPVEFTVMVGDKEITYPDSISNAPAGAVEALRDEIRMMERQEKPDYLKVIPACLALIAVKPYFGEYGLAGYGNSEKLIPLVEALPAAEGFPLANFFLRVSKKGPNTGGRSLGISRRKKRLMQVYRSLASSAASPPLTA